MSTSPPHHSQIAATYAPKRVIASFLYEKEPLETNMTECFPGIILQISLSKRKSSQISPMNKIWLDPIASIIDHYGGDIVCFELEVVTALWQWEDTASHTELRMAALCSQEISRKLCSEKGDRGDSQYSCTLKMSIAAAPEIFFSTIGGFMGRWRFLMSGKAVQESHKAIAQVKSHGGVAIPEDTWNLMREFCTGTPLKGSNFVSFTGVNRGFTAPRDIDSPAPYLPVENKGLEALLSCQMPPPIQGVLDSNELQLWLFLDRSSVRFVTVLYLHLRGFDLGWNNESLHQRLFNTFQLVVIRYKGYEFQNIVDDTGITFAAIFGAPPSVYEGHAARATMASIELQQHLKGVKIDFSIGVSSGSVDYGAIGNKIRRAFVFGGEVLDSCYAIARGAASGVILCDEACHTFIESTPQRLGDQLVFTPSPSQSRDQTMLYEPSLLQSRTKFHTVKRKPYVARKQQFTYLFAKIASVIRNNEGVCLLIEGDSGSGKTFLLDQVTEKVERLGVHAITGTCFPHEKGTPFSPLKKFSSTVLQRGFLYPSIPEVISLDDQLNMHSSLREHLPLVREFLFNEDEAGDGLEYMNHENKMHMTRAALRALSEVIQHPILAIYEDMQWADEHTKASMERIMKHPNERQITILTCRGGKEMPSIVKDHFTRHPENHIKLEPLEEKTIASIVRDELRVRSLPKDLEVELTKSEGNPQRAINLARKLVAEGLIEMRKNEQCLARSLKSNSFNRTLFCEAAKESVVTLFDNMPHSLQSLLEVCSVLETFNECSTRALCPSIGQFVGDHLKELVERSIIEKQPNSTFTFSNTLWREMVYSMLPPARRENLHFLAAGWYEDSYQQDLSKYYNRLAIHYSNAGADQNPNIRQTAVYYLEKAADQALQRFALSEAIFLFTRLIELASNCPRISEDRDKLATWHTHLGEAHKTLGEIPEAVEHVEQALTLLGQPTPSTHSSVNTVRILFNLTISKIKKSPGISRFKLKTAVKAYDILTECGYYQHELTKCLFCTIQVSRLVDRLGASAELAGFNADLALLTRIWQMVSLSDKYFNAADKMIQELDDPTATAYVSSRLVSVAVASGDWKKAHTFAQRCVSSADRIGNLNFKSIGQSHLGYCEFMFGNIEKCLSVWKELLETCPTDLGVAVGKTLVSNCLMRIGRLKEASLLLEEIDHSCDVETGFMSTCARSSEAALLAHHGQSSEALRLAEKVLHLATERPPHATVSAITFENLCFVFCKLTKEGIENVQVKALFKKCIFAFKNYSKSYLMCTPSYLLQYARYERFRGNSQQSQRALHSAIAWLDERSLAIPYYRGHTMLEIVKFTHDPELNARAKEMLDQIGITLPVSTISFVAARRFSCVQDDDKGREFRSEVSQEPAMGD